MHRMGDNVSFPRRQAIAAAGVALSERLAPKV